MGIPLRIVEPPVDGEGRAHYWSAKAGDTWACPHAQHALAGRPPCWVIRLPGGGWVFHTNQTESQTDKLWEVAGTAPALTITPSVNVGPEIWHGFITNGELSPETDRDGKH